MPASIHTPGTGSAPKQIGFPSPVARVEIQAASLTAGSLAIAAYDRTGREVARVEKPTVVDGSTWIDHVSYARLAQAGTCRTLTLMLVDGTAHTASFQFAR